MEAEGAPIYCAEPRIDFGDFSGHELVKLLLLQHLVLNDCTYVSKPRIVDAVFAARTRIYFSAVQADREF